MGFKPPRSKYRLDFEGTDLDGLEVVMLGGKLGDAFTTISQVSGVDVTVPTIANAEVALSQYEEMAAHIISWNLTDDDENPVEPNLEGLKTLEVRYVNMIASAWQKAQVGVPGPLPSSSNTMPDTALSSIRMETLPASLAS